MTVEIEAECEAYEQALQCLEQENAQPLSEEVCFCWTTCSWNLCLFHPLP